MYDSLKTNYSPNNHALHNQRGVPDGAVVKNPPATAGDIRDLGLIPASWRSSGGGNGNPLQYSCMKNPTDERGCPLGLKEPDMTEATQEAHMPVLWLFNILQIVWFFHCLAELFLDLTYMLLFCQLKSHLSFFTFMTDIHMFYVQIYKCFIFSTNNYSYAF